MSLISKRIFMRAFSNHLHSPKLLRQKCISFFSCEPSTSFNKNITINRFFGDEKDDIFDNKIIRKKFKKLNPRLEFTIKEKKYFLNTILRKGFISDKDMVVEIKELNDKVNTINILYLSIPDMKKLLESLKEVKIFAEPYLGRRSIINILQYKKSFVNSDNKKTIKLIIPINDDYKNNTLTLKIKTEEFGGERYKWNYIRVPAEGISLFYKMVEEFLSFHDDIEESATPSGDILESGDNTNRNENISIAQEPLTELNRVKGISHVKKQRHLFKRLYKVHKFTIGQKAYYLNLAQLNNDNENDIIVQINEIDKEKPYQKPKPLWLSIPTAKALLKNLEIICDIVEKNRQSNKLLTYKETLLDREREMNLILELIPYKFNSYAINLCSLNIYNKVILNFFIPFEGIDKLQEKLGYLFGYYDTFNQLHNQIEIFDDDDDVKTINKDSNNSSAIKLKDRLENFVNLIFRKSTNNKFRPKIEKGQRNLKKNLLANFGQFW